MRIQPAKSLKGRVKIPGDKSISHRSVIIGSLADGVTRIRNFLNSADCQNTIGILKNLGVRFTRENKSELLVYGRGMRNFTRPRKALDAGNSGTTMRLMAGLLAAQPFASTIAGDESLCSRPMSRVVEPLQRMGADIRCAKPRRGLAPLKIKPARKLTGIKFTNHLASAQVKSAIMLAGLYAGSETIINEPVPTRDHTERMFAAFGAKVKTSGRITKIVRTEKLRSQKVRVPGDISSAAFFIVAATLLRGSDIVLSDVGVNPTRTGLLDVLKQMGAKITLVRKRTVSSEPIADIRVRSASLKGVRLKASMLPRLIDELPLVMVAAAFARGKTVIPKASELRTKETDRIKSMETNLKLMGGAIHVLGDTVSITGSPKGLKGGRRLRSFGDHRTAMSLIIAALAAEGPSIIDDISPIKISYPAFIKDLERLKTH